MPDQRAVLKGDAVAALGAGGVGVQRRDGLGQRGVVEHHAHFGIELRRAWVEIEGADKAALAIDDEGLGVQAGAATAADEVEVLAVATALEFVQRHAGRQQRLAVVHVAGMHHRHVGGRQ